MTSPQVTTAGYHSPIVGDPERFEVTAGDVSQSTMGVDRSRQGRMPKVAFPRPLLWRIEENLLLKLAVNRLQQEDMEQQQQRHPLPEDDGGTSVGDCSSVNEWEMALFAPLGNDHHHHPAHISVSFSAETCVRKKAEIEDHQTCSISTSYAKSVGDLTAGTEAESHLVSAADTTAQHGDSDDHLESDSDLLPELVQVEWEDPLDLLSCPRILTPSMMQFLHDNGIPESLQGNRWERSFAIGRDGDSFVSFLDRCAQYRQTLLVVQTTEGQILGGFATQTWEGQEGFGKRNAYYGNGQSFLFRMKPVINQNPLSSCAESTDDIEIFKWTGTNDYCQICDVDEAKIAMGGGGDFGIIVEDCFGRGQTGYCGTYGNPPLIPTGFFEIAALEVYGLVPLVQSFHSTSSTISSICREVHSVMVMMNDESTLVDGRARN